MTWHKHTDDPRNPDHRRELGDDFHEAARPDSSELPHYGDLRAYARQMAATDAATGMYGDPLLAAHSRSLVAEAELYHLTDQQRRSMDSQARNAEALGKHLTEQARANRDRCALAADESAARTRERAQERKYHEDRLRGVSRGEKDGDWTDIHQLAIGNEPSARALRRRLRWRRVRHSLAVLGLVIADFVTVFLVMYNQPFGLTGDLATVVKLGATALTCVALVGLSHAAGTLVKTARRVPTGKTQRWLAAAAALAIPIVAQYDLAILRAVNTNEAAIRVVWLMATIGISLITLILAARHHNPHREPYESALLGEFQHRESSAIDAAKARDAEATLAQREHSEQHVPDHWRARRDDQQDEWSALVWIYRRELARRLGDPAITTALEAAPVALPHGREVEQRPALEGELK